MTTSLLCPGAAMTASMAMFAIGRRLMTKAGETPTPSYNLAGTLYLSSTGWLMLSVPNSLVHGFFSAIREPGIELPPGPNGGPMNAHISVIRPEELDQIGGGERITERGKQFHYSVGRYVTVKPEDWPEMDSAYFLTVHSPELQALRRSYGLSSLPKNGENAFHITVAVRRRGVLARNEKAKGLD